MIIEWALYLAAVAMTVAAVAWLRYLDGRAVAARRRARAMAAARDALAEQQQRTRRARAAITAQVARRHHTERGQ